MGGFFSLLAFWIGGAGAVEVPPEPFVIHTATFTDLDTLTAEVTS